MLIRILALSYMCVSTLKPSYRIGTLVKVEIVIPQINHEQTYRRTHLADS
jgi:hypothetical protein